MSKPSFSHFVEQELGKFPHFLIFAVLEWILIALLFLDGLVALAAAQFAAAFGLRPPCLFCTRLDRQGRDSLSHFNASLCDAHKAKLSALAFCQAHRMVAEARRMCEPCLAGTAKKDSLVEEEHEQEDGERSLAKCCSCCGEGLRKKVQGLGVLRGGRIGAVFAAAPAPSPRGRFWMRKRSGSEIRFDQSEVGGCGDHDDNKFREDLKAAMVPLLTTTEPYDMNDESNKTPNFIKSGNQFFRIPLTDSATTTPRLTSRPSRKSPLERTEFASEYPTDGNQGPILARTDSDMDSILVGLDRKSLMALYVELDEERSASAVAANNAMAMITRLQGEKAAVQMEALQYQRMMEEQFEYDQEALQESNDLLLKREEELRALEEELEAYRERFGWLNNSKDDDDDDGLKDFKEEKTYILGRKKMDMKQGSFDNINDTCSEQLNDDI